MFLSLPFSPTPKQAAGNSQLHAIVMSSVKNAKQMSNTWLQAAAPVPGLTSEAERLPPFPTKGLGKRKTARLPLGNRAGPMLRPFWDRS